MAEEEKDKPAELNSLDSTFTNPRFEPVQTLCEVHHPGEQVIDLGRFLQSFIPVTIGIGTREQWLRVSKHTHYGWHLKGEYKLPAAIYRNISLPKLTLTSLPLNRRLG